LERREVEKRIYGVTETLNQSSAVFSGSFGSTVQIVKLEIHAVFRRFPIFHLNQNLLLITLADGIIASLERLRFTASATFLLLEYFLVLNIE